MRMAFFTIFVMCALLALVFFSPPAQAAFETTVGEVNLELTGSANIRAEAQRMRKRVRQVKNNMFRLYNVLVLNGKASTERHTIIAQLRPYMTTQWDASSDHYSEVVIDELYWDGRVLDDLTLTAGRKQIVNGVALGYNPTDFLSHDKQVTGSNLTDTERRGERKGDNLAGFSKFFDNSALQAYALFPNSFTNDEHVRGLAMFSHRIQPLQTDYTLSAYWDDRLQVGVNIAATLSHSVTGYFELALAQDRGRRVIDTGKTDMRGFTRPPSSGGSAIPPGALPDRSVAYKWEKNSKAYELDNYDAVVGFKYTSEDLGISVNMEYWRSNTAFSDQEFNNLWDLVEQRRISASEAEKMFSSNNNVQRDKLFLRVSEIPIVDDTLSLDQTFIYGLNDNSLFLRTSLNWQVSDAGTARLNVNHFNGDRRSEFGMVPREWEIYTSYKYQF